MSDLEWSKTNVSSKLPVSPIDGQYAQDADEGRYTCSEHVPVVGVVVNALRVDIRGVIRSQIGPGIRRSCGVHPEISSIIGGDKEHQTIDVAEDAVRSVASTVTVVDRIGEVVIAVIPTRNPVARPRIRRSILLQNITRS